MMLSQTPFPQPTPLRGNRETFVSGSAWERCVPGLVSHRAASTPRALAVAAGSLTLTYEELNGQANQLAHHLKFLGAGREHLVGIYVKRSPAFIVAALAVLKAGAAYFPLDPESPAERNAFMLRDARVSVVVTCGISSAQFVRGSEQVVDLERDASEIRSQSTESPDTDVRPEDLAYVIYTSGSSGRPKGVEVTSSNLMNLIGWHNRAFAVSAGDRASFLAALGFDAAVWELWPYLTAGASVHLPEEGVRNDAEALRDWLVERKITMSFAPTAMAERLLAMDWGSNSSLRVLLTGADTLRRRPSADLPFQLVNNYGPTECTVVATSGTVDSGDATNRPSIGRPIDNTSIYVMDEAMRPLPQGEAGELYIGGAGVARGYRNHSDLTAQKFVRLRSGPHPGLLYRTGDLGRVLPEGEFQFLGRADEQLKIRGFRVEPSEIITALNSCRGVQASAVVAREQEGGEKRLIAYLSPTPGSTVTAAMVREELSRILPDYMIPATFVRLDSIPVTPNGKVDGAALPEPNGANVLCDEGHVAPQSMVEQRLAALIAPLLQVDRVGVNDNFFLMGGHSLLGTQLITRIRDGFGVDLSLLSLFDHPTLAGMSAEIERLIFAKIEATNWEEVQPVSSTRTGAEQR
jgi:amino acid adenylation domain-containing protein